MKQLVALTIVANYFQLIEQSAKFHRLIAQLESRSCSLSGDLQTDYRRQVVDLYISCNEWNQALRVANENGDQELSRIILFKLAQQNELESDFPAAIINFEKSGTLEHNIARVLIKRHLNFAYSELQTYCSGQKTLRKFFIEYSIECDKLSDLHLNENETQIYDPVTQMRVIFEKFSAEEAENIIIKPLSSGIKEFIFDLSGDKWLNKRKLDSMMSMGMGFSSTRLQLSLLAHYYQRSGCAKKASSVFLLLNQEEAALNLLPKNLDSNTSLRTIFNLSTKSQLSLKAIDYFLYTDKKAKSKNKSHDTKALFDSCLKLGLINEALLAFAADSYKDQKMLFTAISSLENALEDKYNSGIYDINPFISNLTLRLLKDFLQGDQIIATHVITIIVLCLTAILHKINLSSLESADLFIGKSELMFINLSEYLKCSNFDASSELVRATNKLITMVKGKLEALSGSDVVRKVFKQLVECTADRCMIEGQHKSAAMLYSQLEDNVSAVKALMRLGDADLVMNFSVLVRDITVNRITINYLKHLKVDPSVLEDFVARSKIS